MKTKLLHDIKTKNDFILIQALRGVAALLIVFWHSHLAIKLFTMDYWQEGDAIFRAEHYPFWANHLFVGVDIFFCISGFIMCMLADRSVSSISHGGNFLLRRMVRIFPPYWFFTLLVLAVFLVSPQYNVGHFTGNWGGGDGLLLLKSLFLLPQENGPVLGVGWTLIHEFQFYLIIALFIMIGQGKRIPYWLALISLGALCLHISDVRLFYGYGFSLYFFEFFAGALAYSLREKTKTAYPQIQIYIAIAIYFCFSFFADRYQLHSEYKLLQTITFSVLGFLMISGLNGLDLKRYYSNSATSRFMVRVGNASYSLYLSHWFVLSAIGKLAPLIANASTFVVIVWHATSIAVAVAFSIFWAEKIELPLHNRLLRTLSTLGHPLAFLRTAK